MIGYVVEGEMVSGMNDEEAKTYKKGESWYEGPGCYHRVSDNNSKTERAVVLATLVIKTETLEKEGLSVVFQIDPHYLDGVLDKTIYALRSIPLPWTG